MAGPNSFAKKTKTHHAKSALPSTPVAPTSSLPPLGKLATHSTELVRQALTNLRCLYFPSAAPAAVLDSSILNVPKRRIQHPIHDTSVPDSGYASAEEDDDDDDDIEEVEESKSTYPTNFEDVDNDAEIDVLRADPLERAFAIKWVTGFVTRSDIWLSDDSKAEEIDERSEILDEASSLLAAFSGHDDEEDVAITRTFSFPSCNRTSPVVIELNDAPLSKDDHTSVGLQSWGSSILLAERFCLQPSFFSLQPPANDDTPLRILELGAGTGLLSIVAAKILGESTTSTGVVHPEIVATDYHPDVLENLSKNIETNFPPSLLPSSSGPPVTVLPLDWERPDFSEPFHKPFDIILAADVVYHQCHAQWIKQCVERLLSPRGVFWLIIPLRTTGRHEGMDVTVEELFPYASSLSVVSAKEEEERSDLELDRANRRLVTLYREDVGRQGNVGRADEGGYKLFKIGWVNDI